MFNLIVSFLILPIMATDTATQARFAPKELPYAYDALAPQVSEETLRFHHDKHYVGYVNKLNELILDTPYAQQPLEDIIVSADGAIFNNAAQAWNHEFFFDELSPKAQTRPAGALLKAIDESFGSFEQLKAQMEKAAVGLFGSGWVWLAEDKSGRLAIVSEQNAGNPLRYGMTATVAPMPSPPFGIASTGKSSSSVTENSRGLPCMQRRPRQPGTALFVAGCPGGARFVTAGWRGDGRQPGLSPNGRRPGQAIPGICSFAYPWAETAGTGFCCREGR